MSKKIVQTRLFKKLLKKIRLLYASVEAYKSIKSGYAGLQQREHANVWVKAHSEAPYWVCVVFKNGKRVPLPIILRYAEDRKIPGGFIQQLVILIAGYYYPISYMASVKACQNYVIDFFKLTDRA